MRSPHASPKTPSRGRNSPKRKGRPKTWTSAVVREMLALDVCTNLTNDQLLRSLRGSNEGTRTLQGFRKQLLGNAHQRWRSRDPTQMHRRIRHLHGQSRAMHGPRVFSLEQKHCRSEHEVKQQTFSPKTSSQTAHAGTDIGSQSNNLTILFRQTSKSKNDDTQFRIRINPDKDNDAAKVSCISDVSEIHKALEQICQPWKPVNYDKEAVSWSAIFSYVNLWTQPLLDEEKSFPMLHDHVTRLALNNCHLFGVPKAVKSFMRLKYINLQRNRLTEILPRCLPSALEVLDLRHNQITELPEDLLGLKSLRVLGLSHNLINKLPSWLSQWNSLRTLFIDGNPLEPQSYLRYYNTFRYCNVGTKYESCIVCLSVATYTLKKLLSTNSTDYVKIPDGPRECKCRRRDMQPPRVPSITVTDNDGYSVPANYGHDVAGLRDFLQRRSLLTLSSRSSASALTFNSISSAGVSDPHSRLNKQALMLVHCCLRESNDSNPPCMHRSIATWVESAVESVLPPRIMYGQDADGNSMLHVAASFGATAKVLRIGIAGGCSSTELNNDGETILHRWTNQDWHPEDPDVEMLIHDLHAAGFPFEHRDIHGNTIFHKSTVLKLAVQRIQPLNHCISRCRFKKNAAGIMLSDRMSYVLESPQAWFECSLHRKTGSPQELGLYFHSTPSWDNLAWNPKGHSDSCTAECLLSLSDPLHELARLMSMGVTRFRVEDKLEPWDCASALAGILSKGVDANAYNDEGVTVLMAFMRALGRQIYMERSRVEYCIHLLLEYGADARWISRHGDTAMHHAIYYGIPFAVELLIKAGANVNARNNKGLSVMQLLDETMHKMKSNLKLFASFQQCMVILADNGAEMNPTLEQELQWPDLYIVDA